jgi:hypothetical protein
MDARGIGENVSTPVLSEHVRGKGRMYRHPALDELVPSVTNVIGMLDKPALSRWSALEVAKGAYKMRHALTEMDEAEAVGILKQRRGRRRIGRRIVGRTSTSGSKRH